MKTHIIEHIVRPKVIEELTTVLTINTEWVTVNINVFFDQISETFKAVILYYE